MVHRKSCGTQFSLSTIKPRSSCLVTSTLSDSYLAVINIKFFTEVVLYEESFKYRGKKKKPKNQNTHAGIIITWKLRHKNPMKWIVSLLKPQKIFISLNM